jgi:hypothetical protein
MLLGQKKDNDDNKNKDLVVYLIRPVEFSLDLMQIARKFVLGTNFISPFLELVFLRSEYQDRSAPQSSPQGFQIQGDFSAFPSSLRL